MSSIQPPTHSVAEYYDRNTGRFLLVGGSGAGYAIHRQLWGPGVTTVREASDHVNVLLARAIRRHGSEAPGGILDLGCGVGGTLFHLGRAFPSARLTGVTISPRQVEIAAGLAARLGMQERCTFVLGDFLEPCVPGDADVAVAVESLVHTADRNGFLDAARRSLRDGGVLLVVDDFLQVEPGLLDPSARGAVEAFREGWRVPGLCTAARLREEAVAAGFEALGGEELTGLLRTGRPRDRVIGVLAPLFRRLGLTGIPFFGNMIGGNALQQGVRGGWIVYRMELFRKTGAP